MKFFDNPDCLEGYIILVEESDLLKTFDLPELKSRWSDIQWEGVSKKEGQYKTTYLTNNEFALEFIIPDADWLDSELREQVRYQQSTKLKRSTLIEVDLQNLPTQHLRRSLY